jgi:hypothetical protein
MLIDMKFDVKGIKIPGIHFQDHKIAMTIIKCSNNRKIMNKTEYANNN